MDKTPLKTRSAQFPRCRSNEAKESASRKSLLTSFKNYVVSKFRSDKYEVNGSSSRDIRVISYDHHTFNDVEKNYDLISTLTPDERLTRAIKSALSQISGEELSRMSQERMELLQIIERTFNRQLDIFEGLAQINDNTRGKRVLKKHIKAIDEGSRNNCFDDLVEKMKIAVESTPEVTDLMGPNKEKGESGPGDNLKVKVVDINCECQGLGVSGGAVPLVPAMEDKAA